MHSLFLLKEVDCPQFVDKHFFVYLLLCFDGSFYCGSTVNLENRLKEHNYGEGASWTKKRRPVKLVYFESYDSLLSSRCREKQIKGWSVKKKLNLVLGVWSKPQISKNTL